MPNDELFGDFILDEDVQEAIKGTLQKWLPTYLALIERKVGLDPKSLQLPKSYVFSDSGELNKKPENQLPCIAILMPGVGRNTPKQSGDGRIRAGYVANVAIIVTARDADSVSLLAKRYRKAIELILIQQGGLDGFAEGTIFQGWRNDDLRPVDDRTISAGATVVEVLTENIATAGAGPKDPPADPYEETNLPAVTEADVDVEPEEL